MTMCPAVEKPRRGLKISEDADETSTRDREIFDWKTNLFITRRTMNEKLNLDYCFSANILLRLCVAQFGGSGGSAHSFGHRKITFEFRVLFFT
jgi:hypothetical protein